MVFFCRRRCVSCTYYMTHLNHLFCQNKITHFHFLHSFLGMCTTFANLFLQTQLP